jgi:hypothetical protein
MRRSSEASASQIACRFSPSPVEEANTAARSRAARPEACAAAVARGERELHALAGAAPLDGGQRFGRRDHVGEAT